MNYFFLPYITPLNSFLTINNFHADKETAEAKAAERHLYRVFPKDEVWQVDKIKTLSDGEQFIISAKEFSLATGTPNSCFYNISKENIPNQISTLIISKELSGVPEWRANLQIASSSTRTSFQAEYPSFMTGLKKSSNVAMSSMVQCTDGITTKLIYVNIQNKPLIQKGLMFHYDMLEERFLGQSEVYSNTCNILDLPNNLNSCTMVSTCPEFTGVPIYFSHNADFTAMSLEHTHPPGSMSQFGNFGAVQKEMKKWWLSKQG